MTEKKIDFKVDYSKLNIISEHNTKEPRYPMVLSVPHSGRVFPQEFLDRVDVSLNELRSNEDPFVDELVMEASNLGIPMVALNIGRAFIDVNRDAIEIDPAMFYNYPEQEMMIGNKRCRVGLGLFHRITAGRTNIYDGLLNYHEAESAKADRPHRQKIRLLSGARLPLNAVKNLQHHAGQPADRVLPRHFV